MLLCGIRPDRSSRELHDRISSRSWSSCYTRDDTCTDWRVWNIYPHSSSCRYCSVDGHCCSRRQDDCSACPHWRTSCSGCPSCWCLPRCCLAYCSAAGPPHLSCRPCTWCSPNSPSSGNQNMDPQKLGDVQAHPDLTRYRTVWESWHNPRTPWVEVLRRPETCSSTTDDPHLHPVASFGQQQSPSHYKTSDNGGVTWKTQITVLVL